MSDHSPSDSQSYIPSVPPSPIYKDFITLSAVLPFVSAVSTQIKHRDHTESEIEIEKQVMVIEEM
jgi:hypothetical protein